MPGPKELLAIRKRLSKESASYRKLTSAAAFKRLFGEVRGERLKRPPKGFSADDPALDLLLGKQFWRQHNCRLSWRRRPNCRRRSPNDFRRFNHGLIGSTAQSSRADGSEGRKRSPTMGDSAVGPMGIVRHGVRCCRKDVHCIEPRLPPWGAMCLPAPSPTPI